MEAGNDEEGHDGDSKASRDEDGVNEASGV